MDLRSRNGVQTPSFHYLLLYGLVELIRLIVCSCGEPCSDNKFHQQYDSNISSTQYSYSVIAVSLADVYVSSASGLSAVRAFRLFRFAFFVLFCCFCSKTLCKVSVAQESNVAHRLAQTWDAMRRLVQLIFRTALSLAYIVRSQQQFSLIINYCSNYRAGS